MKPIPITRPVPGMWPAPSWEPTNLSHHWNGHKRKPKVTAHHFEFEALTDVHIKNLQDYERFCVDFMRPENQGNPNIIGRTNQYGQLCRYDRKLNLTGSLDPATGVIATVFRPGFAKVKGKHVSVATVDWPKTLRPYLGGYEYFRSYVA